MENLKVLLLLAALIPFLAVEGGWNPKKKPIPDPFDKQIDPPKKKKPLPYEPPKKKPDVEAASKQSSGCAEDDHKCIPKDLMEKMKRVNTMRDFMREFNVPHVFKKQAKKKPGFDVMGSGSCPNENNLYRVVLAPDGHALNEKHTAMDGGAPKTVDMSIPASTACMPRYQLTKVDKPPGTYLNWPGCVYAKRCGGCCIHDFKECVPTKMVRKKHKIFRIPYFNDPYPHDVEVYEHTECACVCATKAKHCINNQVYDEFNCQCICPVRQNCSPGKHWSTSKCNCECDSRNKQCHNDKFYYDEDSCRCKCKAVECPKGKKQDLYTCVCATVS